MKIYEILVLLVFIVFLYDFLPSFWYRYCSSSIKRKFNNEGGIFLTFDDGPNPNYTLEVLELLKKYDVKATFFVVAEKAEKYKDIVDRIAEEGHILAIHSYSHKSAWLSTPWQTNRDLKNSVLVLEKLGHEVKYFRPPWGVFNLFTQYYSKKNGLQTIFWSIITRDWDPNATVDSTVHRILESVHQGSIIVLHDSNHKFDEDNGAPKHTIEALKIILPTLKERGFCFKTIEEGMEMEKAGTNI